MFLYYCFLPFNVFVLTNSLIIFATCSKKLGDGVGAGISTPPQLILYISYSY